MPSKKVTLAEPIKIEGKATITEITVRSPKVREVREIERIAREAQGSLDDAIGAILILTDLPKEAVDDLDTTDIATISETIEGFFPKGRG